MKIEEEIKQKAFKNEYQKAEVNLMFTVSYLGLSKQQALKEFDISIQQFNILRILRGQYPNSATVKLLTERMLDKTSNASRLVDKLLNKGLVERKTCLDDRRRVDVVITKKGLTLIGKASESLDKLALQKMKITEGEAKELNRILDKLRG